MPKQTFFNLPVDKRERIIGCAISEFAGHGYKQASISRMVEAAGIAKGSFYQYFEDKDDLYTYIIQTQIVQRKIDAYQREANHLEQMSLIEFLRFVFRSQVREFELSPELVKISFDLHRLAGEPIHTKIMKTHESIMHTFFLPTIRHKINQGELDGRVNPVLLNYMLLGLGEYLMHMIRTGEISTPDQTQIDSIVDDLDLILTSGIYAGES